jgi:hypothetical protein
VRAATSAVGAMDALREIEQRARSQGAGSAQASDQARSSSRRAGMLSSTWRALYQRLQDDPNLMELSSLFSILMVLSSGLLSESDAMSPTSGAPTSTASWLTSRAERAFFDTFSVIVIAASAAYMALLIVLPLWTGLRSLLHSIAEARRERLENSGLPGRRRKAAVRAVFASATREA